MAYTNVLFRSEARDRILRGATALADAVRVTLGPKSKCVLIQKHFGTPTVCNDGVTIAKEMRLKDPAENLLPFRFPAGVVHGRRGLPAGAGDIHGHHARLFGAGG